ncbi:MAG: protein kinase [Planctomycetia bacterium]|nr:protein kinase [Planctomycetia bacterium]
MVVTCDACERSLEFSGDRPSFCAFCGKKLVKKDLVTTHSFKDAPSTDPQSVTQLPPPDRIITFAGGTPLIPKQIGSYTVIRQLGAGGMGTVYEAEDASNGRRVAVKLIKPQIAASEDNLERFRQEGRLASLITNPRCVFVYHTDEDKGRPYIVMELMPGATLKDIVNQQGPLQIGQAIKKILDVMDGLQAAHQLGVIHRDVKPSNCFVLTDGHVKVGDFGLSKVLPVSDSYLGKSPDKDQTTGENEEGITRTGAFVGTPLYASPEQIKGEMVDFRTDVYSVAATMYFLLTGQAPFEGGDNTATIARIVSEKPQSILNFRTDVPVELDRVILRGLERDREARYMSLQEFRQALLQFLPGYLQNAPRRVRIRAALIDFALLSPGLILIHQLVPRLMPPIIWGPELVDLTVDLGMWLLILAYFLVTEVMAGASFGKWLLHLKVGGLRPGKPPKRRQLLLRALGFFVIVALPGLLALALTGSDWFKWIFHGIGILLLFDSMRAQGGYRGLHEILSRTCVVLVPPTPQQIQFPYFPPEPPAPLPPGIPARIGNYAIDGIHRVLDDRIYLVGKDLILDRKVWLVMRPHEEGKISTARREISRSTRIRWLGGGEVALSNRSSKITHHWDAYIAPNTGCSLTQLVASEGKLSWGVTRYLLKQLADELASAVKDDTFPDELSLEQIWLLPEGQVLVVGARFHNTTQDSIDDTASSEAQRSVQFLKQAAQFMLEGNAALPAKPRAVRAPVPAFDRPILNRLSGLTREPYTSPDEVADDLRKTKERPAEVTAMMRLGQLLIAGTLLSPILLAILVVSRYYAEIKPTLQLTHQVRRADRYIEWFSDPKNIPLFKQFLRDNVFESRLIRQAGLLEFASTAPIRLFSPTTRDQLLMSACQGWLIKQQQIDRSQLQALRNQLSMAAILPQLAAVEIMANASNSRADSQNGERDPVLVHELQRTLRHALVPKPLDQEVLPLVNRLTAWQLALWTILPWFLLWVIWAMIAHGGLSFKLMGIDLQNSVGNRASMLQCGWRSILIWLPFFALILASVWIQDASQGSEPASGAWWIYWIPWWLALIYLAACAVCTLIWPQRGLYDRLAGVYLVPR